MANLTVIGLYFSLETVIFAIYGKFPIRMRMSSYSTNDVRMDLFLGFVSEMESRLLCGLHCHWLIGACSRDRQIIIISYNARNKQLYYVRCGRCV